MDLTGNLQEPTVNLGTSNGRAFTGTHGDGTLTTTASYEGNATNNDWPGINATTSRGVTTAVGYAARGGDYLGTLCDNASISNRVCRTSMPDRTDYVLGIRLGRTSP